MCQGRSADGSSSCVRGYEPDRTARKKSPVETYGTAATADPFTRTRRCFEDLIVQMSGETAGRMTHEELEELIQARGREVQQ